MPEFNPAELTKERTLLDIYLKSFRLQSSRFNNIAVFLVFFVLIIYVYMTQENSHQIAEKIRELASTGLEFVIGILGFLIAGFTIFATITDKKLFIEMAKVKEPRSQLSYLKYVFFIFMNVFTYFLTFGAFCILIKIFAGPNGIVTLMLRNFSCDLKIIIAKSGFVLLGTAFFFLVMNLKSFVFNIYHIVMTTIRWEFEKSNT